MAESERHSFGHRDRTFKGAVKEIAFANQQVPFCPAHLDRAGLKPSDVQTPADMRRVPVTRKVDYRRNFPQHVLARGKTLREPHTLKSRSSGTGGERLTTIAHTYSLAERMWTTLDAHKPLRAALRARESKRPLRYAAPNCSDVEYATPFTAGVGPSQPVDHRDGRS